jgi:uncharacterized protein involved in exopolysaccharide biosynthesis
LDIPTDGPIAKLYRASKKVKHLHTDLIEIRVRSYTPEDAVKLIKATATALTRTHGSMAEPSIVRLRQTLEQTRLDLHRVEANRDYLEKTLNSLRSLSPTERVLLLNNMQQLNGQALGLRTRVADLEERLNPQRSYATSLWGEVQVSERPVFPKSGLSIVLAALLGLFLGAIVALIWNAPKRYAYDSPD